MSHEISSRIFRSSAVRLISIYLIFSFRRRCVAWCERIFAVSGFRLQLKLLSFVAAAEIVVDDDDSDGVRYFIYRFTEKCHRNTIGHQPSMLI